MCCKVKCCYYPTALRRVQISPKTSTNIMQYCTPEDQLNMFPRNTQATSWIVVMKKQFGALDSKSLVRVV